MVLRSLCLPIIHDEESEAISIRAVETFTQIRRLQIIFRHPSFAQALLPTIAASSQLQILDLSFDRKVEPRRSLPMNWMSEITRLPLIELRISLEGIEERQDTTGWEVMSYLRKLGMELSKASDESLMRIAKSMFGGLDSLELVILDDTGSTPLVTEGGIVDAILLGKNYRSLSVHSYPLSASTGPFMDRILPHLPLLTNLSSRTHSLTRADLIPSSMRHFIFYQRPWPSEAECFVGELAKWIAGGHLEKLESVTLAGEGDKDSVALLVKACSERAVTLSIGS